MLAADLRKTLVKTLRRKIFSTMLAALFALSATCAPGVAAQKKSKKPEPTTGGISGRVRVDAGVSASGVSVRVRRGDEEVAQTTTNAKGEFEVQGLAPGTYGLTLRKSGLQIGKMESVEVRAGKTASLKDHLFLPVDEGSIAHLRGSVFSPDGRALPGARIELARVEADGTFKKLDSRVANATGSFAFRLSPERARYRVTAKADGMAAATQDVDIDGAAIFRVALSLNPVSK
ncbi:MAG: erythromycin esterase [Acidobacteriota bacterium]|jgi:hypothetical protein|nr:erythromycin esterase [Acidobacteriota bacterium]